MKKIIGVFICIFLSLLLGTLIISSETQINKKASDEVYNELSKQDKVNVIVKFKEEFNGKFKTQDYQKKINKIKQNKKIIEFSSGGFAIELNQSEFHQLWQNENVEYIEPIRTFELFLSESKDIINATSMWKLKTNNANLNGLCYRYRG
jgi:hypothetical protein